MRSSESSSFISLRPQQDHCRRMDELQATNMVVHSGRRSRRPVAILLCESHLLSRHLNYHDSDFHQDRILFAEEYHLEGFLSKLFRWIRSACFFVLLGLLSIVTYHLLYTLFIMPSPNVVQDLYFDYSQRTTDNMDSDYALIPTATVDLSWTLPLSETDDCVFNTAGTAIRPPFSSPHFKRMKPLKPKQSYSIEIQLLLPDSPVNRFASMFTVQTELYSTSPRTNAESDTKQPSINVTVTNSSDSASDGTTCNRFLDVNETLTNSSVSCGHYHPRKWVMLAQSRRSYRFPFHSVWVTTLYNMVNIVPILWNYYYFDASATSWESHWIYGTSFPHFMEIPTLPLQRIIVKLLQPSTLPSSFPDHKFGLVEIVYGKLSIREVYTDVQQIVIRDFYYTCAWFGSMLISWIYYILYCIIFHKPDPVDHLPRQDPYNGLDDFESFDYYNDIHLDTRSSHACSNNESGNWDKNARSHHGDEFFDAVMFSLSSDSSCSTYSSLVFAETLSRRCSSSALEGASLNCTKGNNEIFNSDNFWEDSSVFGVQSEVDPPLANIHFFPNKDGPPSQNFPVGLQTPTKSGSSECLQIDRTPLLEEFCESLNALPVRRERTAKSNVAISPAQMREISYDELEELWMDSVGKIKHDNRVCENDAVSNGCVTIFNEDHCKERHPFFVFLAW